MSVKTVTLVRCPVCATKRELETTPACPWCADPLNANTTRVHPEQGQHYWGERDKRTKGDD